MIYFVFWLCKFFFFLSLTRSHNRHYDFIVHYQQTLYHWKLNHFFYFCDLSLFYWPTTTQIFSRISRDSTLSHLYNIREMVTNVRVTIHKDTNTTVTDFEILKDRLNTWVWSVKAGADQSQQRRHGEMGLAWWRRYGVGSSDKLSHRVIAAESLASHSLCLAS